MVPNPFWGLLHSRKVWLAIVSAFAGILALWVSYLVADIKLAGLIMSTWGLLQVVLIQVIRGITIEDVAKVEAASRDKALAASVAESARGRGPCDATSDDEHLAELTQAFEAGAAEPK